MKRVLDSNPVLRQALTPIHEKAEEIRAQISVQGTASIAMRDDEPMVGALERRLKTATKAPDGPPANPQETAMVDGLKKALASLKALEKVYASTVETAEQAIGPHGRAIVSLDENLRRMAGDDHVFTRGLEYLGAAGQQLFDASVAKTLLKLEKELGGLIDAKAIAKVLKDERPHVDALAKSITALKKNEVAVSSVVVDARLFDDPATKHLKGMELAPLLRELATMLRAKTMKPAELFTNEMLAGYRANFAEHLDELADTVQLGRKPIHLGMTMEAQNCGGYIRELFDAINSAEYQIDHVRGGKA